MRTMTARDTIADALLDFEEGIVPYRDADARDNHRPAQHRRADAILDALYRAGWLRDDPESKRHHIAKWGGVEYAEGMRWTCGQAGHPKQKPDDGMCICETWARHVEVGAVALQCSNDG